jgi:threonine dehydrogenase-like Zn-dependent dehydrogenase
LDESSKGIDELKAVLFPGNRTVTVGEVPDPRPGPDDAVVRVRASAICRSDMSLYYGQPIVGTHMGTVVPGHEAAGEVVEVGANVKSVKPGDRVAIHLAFGDLTCDECRSGYLMLCPRWQCLGFDVNGGDAEYVLVPSFNCMLIPDEMSFATAALSTDMVGTQYCTQEGLGISGADTVAIFGLGPMGAAAVMVATARGAKVIAIDPLPRRLQLAKELGAEVTMVPDDETIVEAVREHSGGGPRFVIDCSGNPKAQNWSLDVIAKRGTVALVGESRETTINPSDQLLRKLASVTGGWYFPIWQYAKIASFIVERKLPVERMVSHRFQLDDASTAFRLFDEREAEKVVFEL